MQALSHNVTLDPYNAAMPGGRPTSKQPSALGSRIAQARQLAGLSQNDLAKKLSISRSLIAQWERSAVALKAAQLATLAETLCVTVDALVGREETPRRGKGPVGKTRLIFEEVSTLPRHHQEQIVKVVSALVAQAKAS